LNLYYLSVIIALGALSKLGSDYTLVRWRRLYPGGTGGGLHGVSDAITSIRSCVQNRGVITAPAVSK